MAERLSRPAPTRPGDVIDAHTHLFTVGLLAEMLERQPPEAMQRWREALKRRQWGRRNDVLPDMTPAECARWYVERIQAAGVSRAVVMSTFGGTHWTREFLEAANGHVHALAGIDPRLPEAVTELEEAVAAGFKGVKLYPVNRCYRVSEPACRPFFEKVAELRVPVVIHYGVTVDPTGDMRFADPTDLSPVARDFPDTQFIIAHFGAGFLPEVLRVAYQCKNVCVDSSGTNNWLDFFVPRLTLAEVFERCLASLGPERILFGTDSGTTAPYREWIKFQQVRTLEELGLTECERDLILRANAVRIFGLE